MGVVVNTRSRGASVAPVKEAALVAIGAVLRGTYRLVRPLAEGGCGDVYVAVHTRLGSEVAVKVLHPSLAGAAEVLARFRHEADIMAALRHPHIVQILDFDVTDEGIPFLVMELLEGRALGRSMITGQAFDPRAAAHIVDQIAQALQAAHAHGIVHLDLKPDNVILVSTDGRDDFVKVIDFGISRASWSVRPAGVPIIAGTPEYMAPEQACGPGVDIDHGADQFSLAGLAYTLLTGHQPFVGSDPLAVLYSVINDAVLPPSRLAGWLGAEVDAVLERGLSKRPADRFPDILAFSDALRDAVERVTAGPEPAALPASASDLDELPTPAALAEGFSLPPPSGERSRTGQFVRQVRRSNRLRRSSAVLLGLAAAAAFAWFSPPTRVTTRAAWQRARFEIRLLWRGV